MYAQANATGVIFNHNTMSSNSANNINRISPAPTKTSDLTDDHDFVYPGQVVASNNNGQSNNNVSSVPSSGQMKPSAVATALRQSTQENDVSKEPNDETEMVRELVGNTVELGTDEKLQSLFCILTTLPKFHYGPPFDWYIPENL